MAGNDIRSMSPDISALLRNSRLIAINQDPLGAGGRRVRDNVYVKPLADGSVVVGLFNRGNGSATLSASFAEIGLSGGGFTIVDQWTGAAVGSLSASVPAYGVAVFKVSGGTPIPSSTFSLRGTGSGRCMDVSGPSTAPGAEVILYDCHGAANQQWRFNTDGTIVGVQSGLCLDASGAGTANNTRLIVWTCTGQSNQKWSR